MVAGIHHLLLKCSCVPIRALHNTVTSMCADREVRVLILVLHIHDLELPGRILKFRGLDGDEDIGFAPSLFAWKLNDFHLLFYLTNMSSLSSMQVRVCAKDNVMVYHHTRCISMKCGFRTTDGAPKQFVL